MDKKGEINFVAVLLIVAIVVSLSTTFIAINKIEDIKRFDAITGYGTTGTVNITISQNISIFTVVTNISFGQGHVVVGSNVAAINSTNEGRLPLITSTILTAHNWTNSTPCNPQSIEVRNDGNTHAAITLTSDKTADAFLGGTTPKFEFNISNKEAGSCDSGAVDWTVISGASQTICDNFTATSTKNEIYVDVRLQIPYDTVGDKTATFTFGATAAS